MTRSAADLIDPSDLATLTELSDADAAAALNAMTVETTPTLVFGSFRTLAALLTATEYNTLRVTLAGAVAAEAAAGGYLFADMQSMLALPGDAAGDGGGLDLGNAAFVSSLSALCAGEGLATVPGKVAAYVASLQPAARAKYSGIDASMVGVARGTRPLVQGV